MRTPKTFLPKQFLHLFLSAMICIGLTACGGSGNGGSDSKKDKDMEEKDHHNGEEHPDNGEEHPDDGQEHPDESADAGQSLSIDQFADAAENYIKKKSKKHDGHFHVKDAKQDKTLKLELEKVHRKRLSHLGDNTYFVCADFKGQNGKTYDIDIFMEGTKKDNLKEAKAPMVHKVNGEERFTWHEEDGKWKRKKASKDKGMDEGQTS